MMNEITTMTNNVTIFENPEFGQMRTVFRDGEPWFVAADVCRALEIVNHKDAIKRLDEDEKMGVDLTDPHGRSQSTNCINEPGLYALVLGSRKPEAKKFKRWVTHDVIPSIRKTGSYSLTVNRADLSPSMQAMYGMLDEIAATQRQVALVEKKADSAIKEAGKATAAIEVAVDNLNTVMEAFSIDGQWRKDSNDKVTQIVYARQDRGETWVDWRIVRNEIYKEVESRGHFNLTSRLNNMRRKAFINGMSESAAKKLNKVDVIDNDPRLKEIFNAVLREHYIKHCLKNPARRGA